MRRWRVWRWLFGLKELPPPEGGEVKQLPPASTAGADSEQPSQPDTDPEFQPYALVEERPPSVVVAADASAVQLDTPPPLAAGVEAEPALPPSIDEVVQPLIPTPPAIEEIAQIAAPPDAPPVIESAAEEVPLLPEAAATPTSTLPVPVAPPRTAQHPETWIRERARYFSSGRYAPPAAGAESFLAPDLLFRLGIDTHRLLVEAPSEPSPPPASPVAVKPPPRLMDDFTTTWSPAPASADPSGRVLSVDPLLLSLFFAAREDGPEVPAEATSEYLTEPALRAHAITLRGRLLQHWATGGAPVTTRQLYDLALEIAQHPGTALLLCHNVTKAFARGGDAIRWRVINRATGEYSDGESSYRATGLPAAFAGPSIFPALFAACDLGAYAAGFWYRYFACATAACYAANAQTRMPALAPTGEAAQAARRIVDASHKLRNATAEWTPAYRGWLWVNAWMFVEAAANCRNQQAAHAEGVNSLRGACFGLSTAGRVPESPWQWGVPTIGSANGGVSVEIAEWLSPASV
jgi:hypothetical protein